MKRTILAALCAALLLGACGASPSSPAAGSTRAGTAVTGSTATAAVTSTGSTTPMTESSTSPTVTTTPPPPRHPRRHPDPGRLPQTAQLPSASGGGFHREMRSLWAGVRTGRLAPALSAFFPEAAYVQLKAIGDPQGDWRNRLVGAFAQDIAAAHALLGHGAATATLLAVHVPPGYAHWVAPNVCYNTVGYWETPNSRVVYREGGAVRSFGIASMISWRGVWYVVHLGAILRSGGGGEVDDPSAGAGYAAPSSTC